MSRLDEQPTMVIALPADVTAMRKSRRGPEVRNVSIGEWPSSGDDAADENRAQIMVASSYLALLCRTPVPKSDAEWVNPWFPMNRLIREYREDELLVQRWYGVGACECGTKGEGDTCLSCEAEARR